MYRIGILSHYSSMEKDFMHLQGWEGCQLIFKMGVLDLAIEVARKMIEQERVEAIIANSKTAAFIRPYLSVPVTIMKHKRTPASMIWILFSKY